MSATVTRLVERLNAKRSSKGWKAKCPAHDDKEPSLSISEGADGRALLHCHAGCALDEIVAAVGLTKRDLFPLSTSRQQSGNGSTRTTKPIDWSACVEAF